VKGLLVYPTLSTLPESAVTIPIWKNASTYSTWTRYEFLARSAWKEIQRTDSVRVSLHPSRRALDPRGLYVFPTIFSSPRKIGAVCIFADYHPPFLVDSFRDDGS